MYEMLKLQHNGVKIYKSGFPKVAFSIPAQGEKKKKGSFTGDSLRNT